MGKIKKFTSLDSYLNRAKLATSKGNLKEAGKYYEAIIKIDPNHIASLYNLGLIYKNLGQVDASIPYFQKVILLDPSLTNAYDELGNSLENMGRPEEAIATYKRVIGIDPGLAILHNNLGNAQKSAGLPQESLSSYQVALALDPKYADVYNNLGTAYHMLDKNKLAKININIALELNQNNAYYHYNLGIIYEDEQILDKGIAEYSKAIILDSKFIRAHTHLYTMTRQMCDWDALPKLEESIDLLGHEDPFTSITRNEDFAMNMRVAKSWSLDIERKVGQGLFTHPKPTNRKGKIRLGYLSSDFRDHPIGQMVAAMFKYHDRTKFEVIAYSYSKDDKSIFRKQIVEGVDRFVDLSKFMYKEAAEVIASDNVDILIDLNGYTLGNKLEIVALRPAKVQVTWLGFPGTSGASFFDYAIVDKIVAPVEDSKYFTEELLYLPHCYQMNNNKIQISKINYKRSDFGLPAKGIIFGSFNQVYKIEPVMWGVWMNILKQVKGSILWLWEQDKYSPISLKNEAKKAGIDPKRIIFAKKLPKPEHLSRMKLIDIGLDTRVYGGHTTTSDMLWAGVPVITKTGKHFASRVSTSILTRAGLTDLITKSLEDYEELAVKLANNPPLLKQIKSKITHVNLKKNLYDTKGMVKDLEKIYQNIC